MRHREVEWPGVPLHAHGPQYGSVAGGSSLDGTPRIKTGFLQKYLQMPEFVGSNVLVTGKSNNRMLVTHADIKLSVGSFSYGADVTQES